MIERRWYYSIAAIIYALVSWSQVLAQTPWDWQLGEVEENQIYQTEIEIPNANETPLKILQVRSSCGCVDATILQPIAVPNRPARIRLTLDTTGIESPFRTFVYLQTDQEDQPVRRLTVSGRLKRALTERPVHIQFYYDPASPDVAQVRDLLQQLQKQYQNRVSLESFDMTQMDNYTKLYQLEDKLGITRVDPLEVFVDELYLCGIREIRQRLLPLVAAILRGENDVTAPESTEGALAVHLYYTPGCRECRQIKALLLETQQRLSNQQPPIDIALKMHDLSKPEEYAQLVALEEQKGIISNEPMSVWIGDESLAGTQQIRNHLEPFIRRAVLSPTNAHTTSPDPGAIERRFRSFSVAAILGAGLLDGVNPCAFTTLVFFISLLTYTGRQRREIALVGACFGISVFVTYLLIGLGVLHAIQALQSYAIAANVFYYLATIFALVLAAYSFHDAIAYARTGRHQDVKLQLPQRIKRRIHEVMRKNLKTHHLVTAALVIGIVVSGLESICTGQVYLPTIALVTRDPTLRLNAYGYLLLYNLMFITPLIIVFGIAYFGVGSERLGRFAQQNFVAIKFLTACLFVGLAVLMLYGR